MTRGVTSTHSHQFTMTIAGVRLRVDVTTEGGDPALARDFADQIANTVERKFLRMSSPGGEELVTHPNEDKGKVLDFSPQSA